jgi:hypothetical protein
MMMDSGDSNKKIDKLRWAALIVGCCALAFQILVLYPWHLEISDEIKSLTKICMRK